MFTTPCFIRKNTSSLRKKLEELGYKYSIFDDLELDGIITFPDKSKYSIWANYHFDMKQVLKSYIDCGTNEKLFLALAALRDDTDKNQWFIDDNTGVWERSDDDTEYPYNCSGFYYAQCIPYEGNEHLIGKTDDCDEFYKNW